MKKNIDYYLNKGCDTKTAEYFANGRKVIINVIPNNDYTLTLSFNNGEKRLYDMSNLLKKGTVFEFLMKTENFSRVYIDENNCLSWDIAPNIDSNLVWNNKVDLCPDSCYIDSIPIK